MMKIHKEQKRRTEKENRDRRNRDQDDREPSHENNRDFNLQRLPEKRKSSRKVEGFGANPILASYDDKDALKSESMMLFDCLITYSCLFGMFLCMLCIISHLGCMHFMFRPCKYKNDFFFFFFNISSDNIYLLPFCMNFFSVGYYPLFIRLFLL